MFHSPILDLFFLLSIVSIWSILFYHAYLLVISYDFFLKSRSRLEENLRNLKEYPFVSILIPCHNEEIVIRRTLNAMLELDYPREKLEIIPINDQSTDKTGEILDEYAKEYKRVVPFHVPEGQGGKGKAHALNSATKRVHGDVIAVYDADNSPEPTALKYLIAELLSDPKLAAVCGKVRTQNRKKNLLTRFINLEFISHQWIIQGGRWHVHKIAMIPGTNFVIRKEFVDKLGGWDENALTEDTELTFQIREMGYQISFNPFAITWEQEPETWGVWFRQRLRWLKGNQYIVLKYLHWSRLRFKNARYIFYMVAIYGILLYTVIISDLLFLFGILGITKITISGPLLLTWVTAFMLFIITISVTLSFEETSENTLANLAIAVLMYFTYCQMWIVLSIRSLLSPFESKKGKPFWTKTPRVQLEEFKP